MMIKGEYKDILTSNSEPVADLGWKSNTIVKDFGRFLAVLMKKDFNVNSQEGVGVDYIAFGSGSPNNDEFKRRVYDLFTKINDLSKPLKTEQYWVWAKPIDKSSIRYLEIVDGKQVESKNPTNMIRIDVVVEENEPSAEAFNFIEFGLFGLDRPGNGSLNADQFFFINYVKHAGIPKDANVKLNRTIVLKFL